MLNLPTIPECELLLRIGTESRLSGECREREDFLEAIDEEHGESLADQVLEHIKGQVSEVLLHIDCLANEQLESLITQRDQWELQVRVIRIMSHEDLQFRISGVTDACLRLERLDWMLLTRYRELIKNSFKNRANEARRDLLNPEWLEINGLDLYAIDKSQPYEWWWLRKVLPNLSICAEPLAI
jgi:hypothetical protein